MQDIRNPLSKKLPLGAIFYLCKSPSPMPHAYFLRNEHPSVNLALPPVGWHRTVEQPPQMTTVWACEKTVVMLKQPGHLTSMKKERGAGTSICGGEVRLAWQLGTSLEDGRKEVAYMLNIHGRKAGCLEICGGQARAHLVGGLGGAYLELMFARLRLRRWLVIDVSKFWSSSCRIAGNVR